MDVTTDGSTSVPRGGVSGVVLELLASGARGALKTPLTLIRLPLLALQQACSVTGAVRSGTSVLAERGLSMVGLRNGSTSESAIADPTGYLTEPEAGNGEYAEFNPDFDSTWNSRLGAGIDPEMMSDADADLIAELGTDFSSDLAAADQAAAALAAADQAAAALADADLANEDLEAAVADLTAAARAEGVRNRGGQAAAGPPAEPVDIVTRAVVAAEEAAADDTAVAVDRGELPIANFDHVTAGSLRGRLRRLELPELRTLRSYEQEHGHRLPILTLLENRIAKLEAAASTA